MKVDLTNFSGDPALNTASMLTPLAVLTFYRHGLMLKKPTHSGGMTEYPISPDALAALLGEKQVYTSGILDPHTLWVGQTGAQRKVVYYREAQITGLWLEGSDEPVRIPLPGLVMTRTTTGDRSPRYTLHAVKSRPTTPDDVLYAAPLPNTGRDGTCWGTVAAPADLSGNVLQDDLAMFLGSRFGNHNTSSKSLRKKYAEDIRKLWLDLAKTKAETYPLDDLIEMGKFSELLVMKP